MPAIVSERARDGWVGSPGSGLGELPRARQAAADLAARGVTAVALTWVDNSGVTRVKAVSLARLEHAAAWGVGAPVFDTFLVDDSAVVGRFAGGPVGDLRLYLAAERDRIGGAPHWAWAPPTDTTRRARPTHKTARCPSP
jgi:glutamine synthetase